MSAGATDAFLLITGLTAPGRRRSQICQTVPLTGKRRDLGYYSAEFLAASEATAMPVSRRSFDVCHAAVLAAGLGLLVACGQQAASPPHARAAEEAAIRATTADR